MTSMSKYLLKTAKIMVAGTDLSRFGFSLDTPESVEEVDVSGFGGTKEYLPGQLDQTITIGFLQGFGTGEPHRVLQPLFSSGTTFALSVQADSTQPASASNPTFGGTASLYEYNGLNGQLNNRGEITATFRPATNTGFAWGTS
jgi:hypothetical protein